ncbi:MAG TPA: hypothetical protein VHI99_32215 [Vicinamibacterales bacterium]|nr:hypothetical protein [Vicinamibacterales bacterium]
MTAAMTVLTETPPGTVPSPAEMRRTLMRVSLASLARFAPSDGGIVARSLVRSDGQWATTEPSNLNTAEVLKALLLLQKHGVSTPFDPIPLLNRLVQHHLETADYQVVSLSLWAAAIGGQRCAHLLWSLLKTRLPGAVTHSMGLAWVLCALAEYAPMARDHRDVSELAHQMFDRLIVNQVSATGLFRESARREGWLRRRRVDALLSAQVYPILALASFARRFAHGDAVARAVRCADRLCALQGPLGQWWRRYDANQGTVFETYPVYCVNQDASAPGALGALQETLGDTRYEASIERGLGWEFGANELNLSLIDDAERVIARAVESHEGNFSVDRELYAYQPARCLVALLTNPRWASEVAS